MKFPSSLQVCSHNTKDCNWCLLIGLADGSLRCVKTLLPHTTFKAHDLSPKLSLRCSTIDTTKQGTWNGLPPVIFPPSWKHCRHRAFETWEGMQESAQHPARLFMRLDDYQNLVDMHNPPMTSSYANKSKESEPWLQYHNLHLSDVFSLILHDSPHVPPLLIFVTSLATLDMLALWFSFWRFWKIAPPNRRVDFGRPWNVQYVTISRYKVSINIINCKNRWYASVFYTVAVI